MDFRYKARRRKADKLIDKLMPGKTFEEVCRLYEQFYDEWEAIQHDEKHSLEDLLDCLERYKNVLVISDLFPEEGKESWGSYRKSVEYLMEDDWW